MSKADVKKLLEAGAHFGHKTSRWHPKMAPYIHSKRNGNHIIDLIKTAQKLDEALSFIEKTAAAGKQVLLVGTKKQARDVIKSAADKVSMPYVTERWVGGLLTNSGTMNSRIKHLKELEQKMASGALENKYNKLEVQRFQEEIDAMNHLYGGVKELANRPGALFITDILNDKNAVLEAKKLNIPIVAIVDSNADPSAVEYPIPANDDAIKTIQLITEYITEAISAGKAKAKKTTETQEK